jgi:SAM-dependent methyltransferase
MERDEKSLIKGNFGCGRYILEGYINTDNNPNSSADLFHDLTSFPYPFDSNYFDEIVFHHVLEHLPDVFKVLDEVYRISKNNSIIKIYVPHFSCNWFHPGHKTAFSSNLFNFFDHSKDDTHREVYGCSDFRVMSIRVKYMTRYNEKNILILIANKILNYLANLNLKFMERVWCYWVGGFEEIYFEVKVVK